MAYNTKNILKDGSGQPAPVVFDKEADQYYVLEGVQGAAYYRQRGTIAMESWDNTAPVTSFPSERYGFSILNDGTADLTFTINSQTRKVKPGEAYSSLFEPFTSLSISATGAYRAEVLK